MRHAITVYVVLDASSKKEGVEERRFREKAKRMIYRHKNFLI